jgi:hypothetical protein
VRSLCGSFERRDGILVRASDAPRDVEWHEDCISVFGEVWELLDAEVVACDQAVDYVEVEAVDGAEIGGE